MGTERTQRLISGLRNLGLEKGLRSVEQCMFLAKHMNIYCSYVQTIVDKKLLLLSVTCLTYTQYCCCLSFSCLFFVILYFSTSIMPITV